MLGQPQPGAGDIAFLIGGSTPHVQRHGRHEDLLNTWQGALLERGVRDYPLSEARRNLQRARHDRRHRDAQLFAESRHSPLRAALFMDDAIQRHAADTVEIAAWAALPDGSG